jgi:hypothetical protein
MTAIKVDMGGAWWCMPEIPARRRLKQKDLKFEESLGYTARLCLQKQNKNSTW